MTTPAFQPGDRIVCRRAAPSRGTWPTYDGRPGTVTVVNEQPGQTEYGVVLGRQVLQRRADGKGFRGATNLVWFTADELELAS